MLLKKHISLLTISFFVLCSYSVFATDFNAAVKRKSKNQTSIQDTLSWSLSFMKKVFNGSGEWFITNDSFQKPIKGVINYAENDPIDTVVANMGHILTADSIPIIFNRKAENIPNKRVVSGYLFAEEIDRLVESRRKSVSDSLHKTLIIVPDAYLNEGLSKASLVPEGNPLEMLSGMERKFSLSFVSKFNKDWSKVILPGNVTPAEMDTMRIKQFNWTRQSYNDSILFFKRDSLIQSYRENFVNQYSADAATQRKGYLQTRNRALLNTYNESEISKVNDSIRMALRFLTDRAASDSSLVKLSNLTGQQAKIWTANQYMNPMRIFLKNEQNDSISVVLFNNGKGGVKMVIDDGVKFLRFTETQKKEITFHEKKPDGNLKKINQRHFDPIPWKLYGIGTVGFTQTSLSNWAKGGESSLSLLMIEKYTANYSKANFKWENLAEFRLGIFNSKTRGLEKNDDKLEIQSRVGLSAVKKWYYSAEMNFRTQMARGYKYPDKVNPISAFMAPGYLTFSLGMDYKPNKNFSLLLSPLTSKTTFVRDTALINPVNFGLDPGKKRNWEPGAIVKLNWHYPIIENIIYDTRAEIFNNYNYPFQRFNIDWEQTLVLQVTQRISSRVMTQVIYDYNVKFPIKDETGKQIAQEAKWQFKELFTIGFNYKF
ncbi:MAG: DUF3078 domain-containing protein [Prolixibacteraceae bacterium]